MATSSVNMVDAITTSTLRTARSRSAVVRTGKVVSLAGAYAYVRVGSNNDADVVPAGFHTYFKPAVGDIVSLLADGDRWLVVGAGATASSPIITDSLQAQIATLQSQVAALQTQTGKVRLFTPSPSFTFSNSATGGAVNVAFPTGPNRFSAAPSMGFIAVASASYLTMRSTNYNATQWNLVPYNVGGNLISVTIQVAMVFAQQIEPAMALLAQTDEERCGPDPGEDPDCGRAFAVSFTCHTPGCENGEITIPGWHYPKSTLLCGPCGTDIDDIVERRPR